MTNATDIHQHLWGAPLLAALRARRTPPFLDGWTLHLDGEPPYEVDPADHDPAARAAQAEGDGLAAALVSLSSPLGIEWLPPRRRVRFWPPTTKAPPPSPRRSAPGPRPA
ncbi:hypothetical protein ACFQHO_32345 [Actinomadura yumaensis]|uniref:hypothetical protein n=1 Tax=Actinomadura yumaensis TaxID=111807 RepID=UPI00361B536C